MCLASYFGVKPGAVLRLQDGGHLGEATLQMGQMCIVMCLSRRCSSAPSMHFSYNIGLMLTRLHLGATGGGAGRAEF